METGPHRSSSAPATCVTPTNERPEIKTDPVVGARHESRGQKPGANLPPVGSEGERARLNRVFPVSVLKRTCWLTLRNFSDAPTALSRRR